MNNRLVYEGPQLSEISFPLGGIGTGCIGLAGNGRLIDWEIWNKPNKGGLNGFSHFAVKAENESEVVDARVLHGDLAPPYSGTQSGTQFNGFGFGVPREYMTGFPHFRNARFTGEFPVAEVDFIDESFPGSVRLTAFNPLIPGNDRDSSIPAAFFEFEIKNTGSERLTYTVAATVMNPCRAAHTNAYRQSPGFHLLHLGGEGVDPASPEFGDLSVATDSDSVSYQEYLFRGTWFDNVSVYWQDFTTFGPLKIRTYDPGGDQGSGAYGKEDQGILAAHFRLDPDESRQVRFVISWSYPNMANYWNPEQVKNGGEGACCSGGECSPTTWKNFYATVFADSVDSATYCLRQWDRLADETKLFRTTFFSSTLPDEVIEAAAANISILKSPTVLRLEDGTFYGFEGCHPQSGCCEGSCTHVWNYAYALPFLFPSLERSMRDVDYTQNLADTGGMTFRLPLPIGRKPAHFRACADGQFGGIIKMYREWKVSGDTEWLQSHWDGIKKNLEFAWSDRNPDQWDRDRDGVLEGRQHHTLDMELFGPNSWLTGFYLAALLAAAEMAEHFNEADTAASYRELFERGKAWADTNLFNGEYYHQLIDLSDRSVLQSFEEEDKNETHRGGRSVTSAYWDDEHEQIKYQVAEGCGVDQVIGQWHANLAGLGRVFDQKRTVSALQSIYRYNFMKDMREHVNPCRLYALNDESALLICSFPRSRPVIAVPYAEEAMNGFEYQAACHMIQEGLVTEGLEVVRAIRARYDGVRRNPWNEFECGSNYARSMASYALILAMSGFEYDMVKGHIGFAPVTKELPFRCFWSLDSGWGQVEIGESSAKLSVLCGSLSLRSFKCTALGDIESLSITAGSVDVAAERSGDLLRFESEIVIAPEKPLAVRW